MKFGLFGHCTKVSVCYFDNIHVQFYLITAKSNCQKKTVILTRTANSLPPSKAWLSAVAILTPKWPWHWKDHLNRRLGNGFLPSQYSICWGEPPHNWTSTVTPFLRRWNSARASSMWSDYHRRTENVFFPYQIISRNCRTARSHCACNKNYVWVRSCRVTVDVKSACVNIIKVYAL